MATNPVVTTEAGYAATRMWRIITETPGDLSAVSEG